MYPEFEHDLAMALGDEFDGNSIHAYQLADFADSCQLSRSFMAKRLKYLIGKLLTALQEEPKFIKVNNKEGAYLNKYQELVIERCKHLLKQSNQITSMKL
ncbi:HipA protein [Legionella hackeliae]|uniref:Uncharacterized protein n=1 Tax=Legionella hackeliae TaxID=449 RepID=A0A0A8URJ4_LEGHA|nr:hypothetical protein Lhac_2958 [Legionella hackeliae]CEK10096.1 conserved protein of unknown function [Legionella hackeliae]STX46821.1 HipA protein [Legionella hackeliae]